MSNFFRLAVVAAAIAAAAIAGSTTVAARPASAAPPQFVEETPCTSVRTPDGQAGHFRCGTVTVPEDRAANDGRTVKLHVAVLTSTSAKPQPDPVLYLTGGPGFPALSNDLQFFDAENAAPLQSARDLVFYDQRGTGVSEPGLYCPEVRKRFLDDLAQNLPGASDADPANAGHVEALAQCKQRLLQEQPGLHLDAYSSADSAADIADIMTALGYARWNLFGISYGTRLALTTMRDFPQYIRSAVIDSVVPPEVNGAAEFARNFERSVHVLATDCAANAACNAAYPNFEDAYYALIQKLNVNPIVVEPTNPDTGEKGRVVVTGDRLLAGTHQALYDTRLIPVLPFAQEEIRRGNTALLETLTRDIVFSFNGLADAMATSVECNEEVAFNTAQVVAQANSGVRQIVRAAHMGVTDEDSRQRLINACNAWDSPSPAATENQPVVSTIPSLVLAGQYDPITPPSWSRQAAGNLANSFFYEFPATGHSAFFGRFSCAMPMVAAFIAAPSTAPEHGCVAAIPPPNFQVHAAEAAPTPTARPSAPTPTPRAGVAALPNTGAGAAEEDAPGPLVAALLVAASVTVAAGARMVRRERPGRRIRSS